MSKDDTVRTSVRKEINGTVMHSYTLLSGLCKTVTKRYLERVKKARLLAD